MNRIPRAHDRLVWTPLGIGRIDVVVTRVARDHTWASVICTLDGRSWRRRQRLPLPPSFTAAMAGGKPTCEGCGAATGWGRAIRREPGTPLHCVTCALLDVRTAPRLHLVGVR